jgi:hypothetical protein
MRMHHCLEFQLFLGFTSILLLFIIIVRIIQDKIPKNSGPWLFALFVFIMICFPRLQIAGINIIYLPTALLHFTPFFNNIRCPTRIQVLISLLIPLCGTWFIYSSEKKYIKKFRNLCCLALTMFCIFELTPYKQPLIYNKDIPLIMSDVKKTNKQVLLTIPLGIRDGMKQEGSFELIDLYYQTFHSKSLISGYISRIPKETYEIVKSDSVISNLLTLSINKSAEYRSPTNNEIKVFFDHYKVGSILIHSDYEKSTVHSYIKFLLFNKKYSAIQKEGWTLYTLD